MSIQSKALERHFASCYHRSHTTGVTKKGRGKSLLQYLPVPPVPLVVLAQVLFCRHTCGSMSTQAQPKGTVLVVDDDDAVRSGLYWALASDYQVLQAASRD